MRRLLFAYVLVCAAVFASWQCFSQTNNLLLLGVGGNVSGGGCAQATTLIARMDGSQNTAAVTTLVCGMVTDGTWSGFDALYILAINSTTNAKLNWVSSSYSLTVNGTCTFTANAGYAGDASTCYLNPAFVLTNGVNYTLNSGSLGFCDISGSSLPVAMGVASGGNYSSIYYSAGAYGYVLNDYNFPIYTSVIVHDLIIESRTSSTLNTLYFNGSSVATSALASDAVPTTYSPYFMAQNDAGTADNFSGDSFAYFFIGKGFSSTNVSNIRSRLATYMTTVNGSGC